MGSPLLDLAEAERARAGLARACPAARRCSRRDLELCSRLNLWHAVHCEEQIDMLALHKTHQPHRVFLKMNSGMNRLGFTPQRLRAAWTRLNALPQVDEISLMTHFSDADGPGGIAAQMAVFSAVTQDLPGERSLCNSAATLRHAGQRFDGARAASRSAPTGSGPASPCSGSAPDFPAHDIAHWDLRPHDDAGFEAHRHPGSGAGDSVGYGSPFRPRCRCASGVVAWLRRRLPAGGAHRHAGVEGCARAPWAGSAWT